MAMKVEISNKYERESNYQCHTWMVTELHLNGVHKDIFAIIYSFTWNPKNPPGLFTAPCSYLVSNTGFKRTTVSNALKDLESEGYITKSYINKGKPAYRAKRKEEIVALLNLKATHNNKFHNKNNKSNVCEFYPDEHKWINGHPSAIKAKDQDTVSINESTNINTCNELTEVSNSSKALATRSELIKDANHKDDIKSKQSKNTNSSIECSDFEHLNDKQQEACSESEQDMFRNWTHSCSESEHNNIKDKNINNPLPPSSYTTQGFNRDTDLDNVELAQGRPKYEEKINDKTNSGATSSPKSSIPTLDKVLEYGNLLKQTGNLYIDCDNFYRFYERNGWKDAKGKPIEYWKGLFDYWNKKEKAKIKEYRAEKAKAQQLKAEQARAAAQKQVLEEKETLKRLEGKTHFCCPNCGKDYRKGDTGVSWDIREGKMRCKDCETEWDVYDDDKDTK